MAAHWKFGKDFAIRYGGYRDIQWFKGEDFEKLSDAFSSSSSSPTASLTFNPAEAIIDVSKSVALFLQWWEMHQQTLLQSAAFEERRTAWIADIFAQWFTELEQGIFRLDTVHYLDREISQFLIKAKQNTLIDAPSTLLLQIERSTNLLIRLNSTINNLILEQSPNFTLPDKDIPQSFNYQPYFLIEQDKELFNNYVNSANDVISTAPSFLFSLGINVGVVANTLSKGHWATALVISGLLWTVPKLFEARDKIKSSERLQDFTALQNFSIELRSTNVLLRLLQELPLSLKVFNTKQTDGKLILLEGKTGNDEGDL